MKPLISIFFLMSAVCIWTPARAEDPAAAPAPAEAPAAAPTPSATGSSPKAKSPRKAPREKEAEGTQAIERIQEDPVIKSPYKLHGEQLEVDPD